jgi:NAD(P)H-hydrate epimerase
MRESDARTIAAGTSGRELMARAGRAIFEAFAWEAPVAVVCGSGNNAGDGYVLASLLREAGIGVTLVLADWRFSPDGRYYFDRCEELGVPAVAYSAELDLSEFAVIADCLFGTGFRGVPEGRAAEVIEKINASGAKVVSVDINSGLSGRNGLGEIFVKSDLTVSIGNFQPGHFLNKAKDAMKSKVNRDIGIEPVGNAIGLIEESDVRGLLAGRPNLSNKGDYGYIALVGGSLPYSGAIRLAAMSNCAMRAGAGVASVAAPESVCRVMMPEILESTLIPLSEENGFFSFREEEAEALMARRRLIACGMGIGNTPETAKLLGYLIDHYTGILLVDADALTALAGMDRARVRGSGARLLLTPHPGEFARLSGLSVKEVLEAPVENARSLAKDLGAAVLLKGPATVVTDGDRAYISDTGCPGMASAGSGDVLSGILAAVCAYAGADDLAYAAAAGAYSNGLAGRIAQDASNPVSMTAGDTASAVRDAVTRILSGEEAA